MTTVEPQRFMCPSCRAWGSRMRFTHEDDCHLTGRGRIYVVRYEPQESPSAPWHIFEVSSHQAASFCWFYDRPDAERRAFAVATLLNDMELEMAIEDD